MPLDKVKSPDWFPASFHIMLTKARQDFDASLGVEGSAALTLPTQKLALREARRFRTFLKSLRAYPLHPRSQLLYAVDFRTQVRRRDEETWQLTIRCLPLGGHSAETARRLSASLPAR